MNTLKSSLAIKQLRLPLKIGLHEAERSKPQDVDISFKILFHQLPQACNNDDISQTICYDNLCKEIISFCSGKEFILIERLCYQLFNVILSKIGDNLLYLTISKCQPPVQEIKGGSMFTISNFGSCNEYC